MPLPESRSLIASTGVGVHYYGGEAAEQVLKLREKERRESGFDTRLPSWEPGIPPYDARTDPHCPVSRTAAFRRQLSRGERADAATIERARASARAPPLPSVRAAGVGTDRPLWSAPPVQVQVVRCVEAYEFQLVTVRHFVRSLPAELSSGGSMLAFARDKLAELLAAFRYAVLNVVETVEQWRARSRTPAEPFLWAGANLYVTMQLDVLETFSPLRTARDPLLLRCFPTPLASRAPAAQPRARAPLLAPAAARRATRLASEPWMIGRQPSTLRGPAECFWPGRLHSARDLQRILRAERALVREAAVVGAPLLAGAPAGGGGGARAGGGGADEPIVLRLPTSAELKLRVICHGTRAMARWHARLRAAAAARIQTIIRRRAAVTTADGVRREAAGATIHRALGPLRDRAHRRVAAAVRIEAHARRLLAARAAAALLRKRAADESRGAAVAAVGQLLDDRNGAARGARGAPACHAQAARKGRLHRTEHVYALPAGSAIRPLPAHSQAAALLRAGRMGGGGGASDARREHGRVSGGSGATARTFAAAGTSCTVDSPPMSVSAWSHAPADDSRPQRGCADAEGAWLARAQAQEPARAGVVAQGGAEVLRDAWLSNVSDGPRVEPRAAAAALRSNADAPADSGGEKSLSAENGGGGVPPEEEMAALAPFVDASEVEARAAQAEARTGGVAADVAAVAAPGDEISVA
ncbi:hypothetical protein KFE25_001011 [Diacronema lutheri]|uniref:Uncharacterized protein n=1 Tax=Diacronema lutheri TaxID=2081491 RepID=A0A8J5XJ76_DIALT|nr:hypothetical protein KFE25_001011 [Diacronema lutheri]